MIQRKLIDKFGGHINHMSCIYLNDGEKWLRYFLDKCKAKCVLEIGTYQGVSTAVISEYAKKVYAVDIEDQLLRKQIWDFLNIKNIDYVLVKDREQEIKKVNGLFKKADIDLIFLDGEHFHGELEKDYDMVKECKQILIHDYSSDFKEVYDFCNSLSGYTKEVKGSFILLTSENQQEEIKPVRKKRGRKKKQ